MYIPSTKWTWTFLGLAVVQACFILAFESYVFAKFQLDLHPRERGDKDVNDLSLAIPTFLTLYIFGFLYDLFLVYDALRMKNTIQVIGLVLMNLGLLIYGGVQFNTVSHAVQVLKGEGAIDGELWEMLRPYMIAIPVIIAVFTVLMAFVAWKLYGEFAWTIYKHISADLRMKRRFLNYQIYIALLKFDFFFFLGFTIQFVVIVRGRTTTEWLLTIVAIPITILILIMAAFFMRHEILTGMIVVFILFFAGLAYFIFKLYRMYEPVFELIYQPARNEMTTFAVITILLIVVTLVYMGICCANFNKGLKPYVTRSKSESDEEKTGFASNIPAPYIDQSYRQGQQVELTDPYGKYSSQGRVAPTRMEID